MCKVQETSKSVYYNWLSTEPSKIWSENQEIMGHREWLLNMKNKVLRFLDHEQQE
ncbi:MAG: hypothetical protein QNL61_07190 [Crocinitomicaceae bacterium]